MEKIQDNIPEISPASDIREKIYRIFTITNGNVQEGVKVDTLSLKNSEIIIPAVIVGEKGRGRNQGVLPVNLNKSEYSKWKNGEEVTVMSAKIGETRTRRPKLLSSEQCDSLERIIAVFRTKIGYRGSNNHTGDRKGWKCTSFECDAAETGVIEIPDNCPKCEKSSGYYGGPQLIFEDFPGIEVVSGIIAQGAAGRMGNGKQIIAIMPRDEVFRTSYSGRLYGAPSSHYYKWDGRELLSATWNERTVSDLF